jgi:hypothetical protein
LKGLRKGRGAYFGPPGKLALTFLKAHTGLSDRKLVEILNGNFEYQMFLGIFLDPERLHDFKFVSKIRTPRTKFLVQKVKYFVYMHKRKKPWKNGQKDKESFLSAG